MITPNIGIEIGDLIAKFSNAMKTDSYFPDVLHEYTLNCTRKYNFIENTLICVDTTETVIRNGCYTIMNAAYTRNDDISDILISFKSKFDSDEFKFTHSVFNKQTGVKDMIYSDSFPIPNEINSSEEYIFQQSLLVPEDIMGVSFIYSVLREREIKAVRVAVLDFVHLMKDIDPAFIKYLEGYK